MIIIEFKDFGPWSIQMAKTHLDDQFPLPIVFLTFVHGDLEIFESALSFIFSMNATYEGN